LAYDDLVPSASANVQFKLEKSGSAALPAFGLLAVHEAADDLSCGMICGQVGLGDR
jgi:hypothetical protein